MEQIEVISRKELEDAKKELNNEISNLSLVFAEELIRNNLKKGDQTRLLEDYIKSIGS